MTPFDAGRTRGQHIAQTYPDGPGVRTPEQVEEVILSELDLLYGPSTTRVTNPRNVEHIQIDRDYNLGILQGLKDGRG